MTVPGPLRPLDGLTVIALEQAVAAPLATRQLADLGARVIKIERPGSGDFARQYDATVHGQSSHFVWLNRSKESLTLDLKHPRAQEVLQRLLAGADVLVQNLAPGAAARLGLAPQALHERHPRLVICGISGYGEGGPYAGKKAYDLLVQAESGLLAVTGTEAQPCKVGISAADIAAGTSACQGILGALLRRERGGGGAILEISMLEALGEWMGYPLNYALGSGRAPGRSGARHATIAPYGPFRTGDGGALLLGVQNEREWRRFCEQVLGEAALADDPRFAGNAGRVANREALEAVVAEAFAALDLAQAEQRLETARIAYGRMRSVQEFAAHPQLRARRRWRSVDSPGGAFEALLPPALPAGAEPRMDPVPALGQHTEAILGELGLAARDIARLREARAI